MPVIEFVCEKCGEVCEKLTKIDQEAPLCPKCGAKMSQKYSGKCFNSGGKKEHCSGHCATCGGCK